MAYKFFHVRAMDPDSSCEELNRFLASQRVLRVDRQFVIDGAASFWSICVDYLFQSSHTTSATESSKRSRVDYRELLSPEQFGLFVKLRDLRNKLLTESTNGIICVWL